MNEWIAQVRQVRRDDAGRYRCTVNTSPVRSKVVYLHVKGHRVRADSCYHSFGAPVYVGLSREIK